ncbi:MAG: phosphatase [Lachnospiraceae bacterium]|jgi:3D (Asp-Asp-Asp) domain-containing protein|nr:phosphatase [Lachnospiraceae bacterium]
MKTISRFVCIILLISIFTIHTPLALASDKAIRGHLDSISGDSISGWIWDSQSPDTSLTATVTVTNTATGETAAVQSVQADEYRDDLMTKGIGDGSHGFHAVIRWDTLPEAAYSVSISSNGSPLPGTLLHTTGDTKLVSLGSFKTTAYCPCYRCSEGWGRNTSSGALAAAGHTVAVDPRVIPIGSHLLINGVEYIAEDTGGAVKGNHIDIYFNSHTETLQHGTRRAEVFLIQR